MADIDVERKNDAGARAGVRIWPWIVGLVVVGLVIWAAAEVVGHRRRTVATAPDTTAPGAPAVPVSAASPAADEPMPVEAIAGEPGHWLGKSVSGTAPVARAISGHGYWLGSAGQRVLLVVVPVRTPGMAVGQPLFGAGQTIRVDRAIVEPAAGIAGVTGLDAATVQAARGVGAFLLTDAGEVAPVGSRSGDPTGQAGVTGARR